MITNSNVESFKRFDSPEDILADIAAGKMVIMLDDEDRENEGDLIMAAAKVTAEDVNFMARFGRGLICLTLSRERCEQLRLPLMVSGTDRDQRTNFTVTIEAAEGVTTGISAHDRAHTIRVAVAEGAKPEDLNQPGHIFPLMAQPGGVLTRAGHTEAGCDLARIAGLEPAAMIVEILNEDGSMARRDDLMQFAQRHQLKIGTIADLIRYRLTKESSVEPIMQRVVPTEFGDFTLHCFDDHVHRCVHLALVKGSVDPTKSTLVRVHVQDTLGDVVGVSWPELGWPLRDALKRVADEGNGVVVLLRPGEKSRQLVDAIQKIENRSQSDKENRELRTYGIGAQILNTLGVKKMRLLSAPLVMHGLSGFDLEVTEYLD